jgi:hypothetical protein
MSIIIGIIFRLGITISVINTLLGKALTNTIKFEKA